MPGLVEGKIALITGGAAGIGRATALTFAREGAKVVVADVMVDGAKETVKLIKDAGGDAAFVRADVSQAAEVEALVNQTIETYGRLDCAHNNAGVEGDMAPTHEYQEGEFNRVLRINLKGVWLCLKYEIPQMLKQGSGSIVNTSSVAGLIGFPTMPAYVASKHAVAGLTKTAALEYAKSGIRVNAVSPGSINTGMVDRMVEGKEGMREMILSLEPVGRQGTAQEVAESVVWLCSDAASFVTGHVMAIDGGWAAQ